MTKVTMLKYGNTKCYLVQGTKSRNFLRKCGIDGEILSTPGHSECSVSYILDNGEAFVGDLYPMEQVALYDNPVLTESWRKLKQANIKIIHFAHYPDEKIADYPESDF